MEETYSFGYWVMRRRKALDLTRAGLAHKVSCSPETIKKIERDERRPSRQVAEILAEVLGVPGGERDLFLQTARGERAVDHLRLATHPITPHSPERPRHNLPRQLSNFVGRERELAEVRQLLGTSPLVTLTGAGGSGKSRLALEAVRDAETVFADGLWLVELAPLSDPALAPSVVASTLGLVAEDGKPILASLLKYLSERQLLLLLDNCEHLIEAVANLVEMIMNHCRGYAP